MRDTSIAHEQLKKQAAPAFADLADDLTGAVRRAEEILGRLGGWPVGEEADEAFVAWYGPKRRELPDMIEDFAAAYRDLAEGLLAMRHNVATVDWGLADDLRIRDVPVYTWP
ncbi:hypothetical protein ACIBEJ_39115 [Nonomuraea sp. NPDC050790]|uniref:hypothetical protein n=1 Tax=Nonomuraea sp. NPDC050790 TaxID=3364371 RepID=UPI00378C097F